MANGTQTLAVAPGTAPLAPGQVPQPYALVPTVAAQVPVSAQESCPSTITLPNVVTIAGYVAGVAWIAGGPWWLALLSILADELDKPLASLYGQRAQLADILDFPVDMILAAMTLQKLKAPVWAFPVVTTLQVAAQYLPFPVDHPQGRHPAGRIKSGLMLAALWQERQKILGAK